MDERPTIRVGLATFARTDDGFVVARLPGRGATMHRDDAHVGVLLAEVERQRERTAAQAAALTHAARVIHQLVMAREGWDIHQWDDYPGRGYAAVWGPINAALAAASPGPTGARDEIADLAVAFVRARDGADTTADDPQADVADVDVAMVAYIGALDALAAAVHRLEALRAGGADAPHEE